MTDPRPPENSTTDVVHVNGQDVRVEFLWDGDRIVAWNAWDPRAGHSLDDWRALQAAAETHADALERQGARRIEPSQHQPSTGH